jgi:hypothetical protein
MLRSRVVVVGLVAALALGVSAAFSHRPSHNSVPLREAAARAGGLEGQEEAQVTAERLEALARARARGVFGSAGRATTRPAPGWAGSRLMNPSADDWEPAVATDPSAPYVYLLTTRYGVLPPGCSNHCPSPFIALTSSSDGGSTFGEQVPLCLCLGSKAQYDPTIEVVPDTGAVYSVFLNGDRHNGFSTVFTKSTDHGRTWSAPVHVYGNVSWTDKPEVATSASGKDIYVSWNGPQGGDLYVGQSHDYGATWTQQKLTDTKRYYYAYDARVLSDGTVVFSESSLQYSGSTTVEGEVWHHAIVSRDEGTTWENVVIARVPIGEACVAGGCKPDFYLGQTSVVSDAPGISSSRTKARALPAARSRSTSLPPLTRAERGPQACRSRRPARTRHSLGSRRSAATFASGTCRPAAATTPTPGTCGTAARPTAGRRGPLRSTSPTRLPERPATSARTGSRRSTATTARWA